MNIRQWLTSVAIAAAVGLAVAIPVTVSDWRLNPAGVFRDAQGTHWGVVAETALSWFWPLAALALVVSVAVNASLAWRRARRWRELRITRSEASGKIQRGFSRTGVNYRSNEYLSKGD